MKPAFRGLLLAIIAAFLFSFSARKGGDSFEIYVNGKLVVQQYVAVAKGTQDLVLGNSYSNDKIDVYYSHCGKIGTERTLSIKDAQNHLLKQWKFADAATKSPMSCQIKDILSLQKNKNGKLSLYYSSKELPAGRLLVAIDDANGATAGR